MERPSNSRIDAAGKRLRDGRELSPEDTSVLSAFREARDATLAAVVEDLRTVELDGIPLDPTGRLKSWPATVDKVRRGKRLSSVEDIAGVRLIVPGGVRDQDTLRDIIVDRYPGSRVTDSRVEPKQGYRALHIVVPWQGEVVEVQVRTAAQHRWAELHERAADALGREYRSSPPGADAPDYDRELIEALDTLSTTTMVAEVVAKAVEDLRPYLGGIEPASADSDHAGGSNDDVHPFDAFEQAAADARANLDATLEQIRGLS